MTDFQEIILPKENNEGIDGIVKIGQNYYWSSTLVKTITGYTGTIITDIEEVVKYSKEMGLPRILRVQNVFLMLENCSPQLPGDAFAYFFKSIKETTEKYNNIVICFKIGGFSSNFQQILKKLFEVLNKSWYKCEPVVNWYHYDADTDMLEDGEMYQEWNPQIKFRFFILPE